MWHRLDLWMQHGMVNEPWHAEVNGSGNNHFGESDFVRADVWADVIDRVRSRTAWASVPASSIAPVVTSLIPMALTSASCAELRTNAPARAPLATRALRTALPVFPPAPVTRIMRDFLAAALDCCHCEERIDGPIQSFRIHAWIASLHSP